MESEKSGNTVTMETKGELLIVRPFKEIDVNVSKNLLTEVRRRIDEGHVRIIMDLSTLEFIDSTGLSAMVDLQDAATKLEGKVVFASVGTRVMRILKVTRLDRYIEQYPNVAAAEEAFKSSSEKEAGVA